MTEKKIELDALKDQIDNIQWDIETRLEWKWATRGYINALASRESADLIRKYNSQLGE